MAVNKLIIDDVVELDLTSDTVTADKLMSGYTAHDKSGALITGTMEDSGMTVERQTTDGAETITITGKVR